MPKQKLSEILPVAEVQQTFYQPPMIRTLEKWRSQVQHDFEFTIKAWQLITHPATSPTYRRLSPRVDRTSIHDAGFFRDTDIVQDAWQITVRCALALGASKVLFQCPASFKPTEENIRNIRKFAQSIERSGLTLLWEPRGDWPSGLVSELCSELELVHVVDPFKNETTASGLRYYRLHGIGGYRYQYSDEELEHLAELVSEDGLSYVMFNNTEMLEDAIRFQRMLEHKE